MFVDGSALLYLQMRDWEIKQSIFDAAVALHGSLDPGEVIHRGLEAVSRLIRADAWAVFLKDENAEHLELVRAVNATGVPAGPFVDLHESQSVVAEAARARRTVASNGGSSTSAAATQSGTATSQNSEPAALAIPLTAGTRVVGAVQAAREQPFTADEARDLEMLGRSLGLALANAIDHRNATRQTLIDDLTRLYNVRYLYQTLDTEIRRARRYGSGVSIVFMDLDGFKLVNDRHGHRAGSVTLTEVAQVILASVRDSDFVARYGGDEFVLMLPETNAIAAVQMAERVRTRISGHRFSGGVGAEIHLTASFGVASYPEHASVAEKLIELADGAMYEAKQHKKDSVHVAAS